MVTEPIERKINENSQTSYNNQKQIIEEIGESNSMMLKKLKKVNDTSKENMAKIDIIFNIGLKKIDKGVSVGMENVQIILDKSKEHFGQKIDDSNSIICNIQKQNFDTVNVNDKLLSERVDANKVAIKKENIDRHKD
jgi:hypothetical protein